MATATDFTNLIADAQKQTFKAIEQAQDWSLRATELTVGLLPASPAFPLSEKLPTPAQIVEASFGFARQLLDNQKAYALKLAELATAGAPANGTGKS